MPTAIAAPAPASFRPKGPRPWHALPENEVVAALGTGHAGLAPEEARRRLEVLGPNLLQRQGRESVYRLLWRQVNTPLIYVLLAAGALAMGVGKTVDGLVVLGVVAANALIGFFQEFRAGRAIEALVQLVPERTTVVRGGAAITVEARELVPGDVVRLQSGDRVPADLRLLAVRGLRVDEATLTGESLPVEKATEPLPADAALGDRANLAFGGTLVTYGAGTGVVVATGAGTELGRISALLRDATELQTPLTRQLASVGKWITAGIVAVAAVLFGIGLYRGYPPVEGLLAAITLAVGAIPEGLPAILTIALAIGVRRMARRRAIIRRLPAAETLGSTTVICSDKTGTLTRNEMTVQAVWTPAGRYAVEGIGYTPEGGFLQDGFHLHEIPDDLREVLQAGVLCSDAAVDLRDGSWRISGDPTEAALVVAARKAGFEPEELRHAFPRKDAVPFESERQFMATLHGLDGRSVTCLKGAPEVVLDRCETLAGGGAVDRHEVLAEVERMAAEGARVLALASRSGPASQVELSEAQTAGGFVFLGLQGMTDPPRAEAIEAVRACRRAGIAVKMITGDHRATAEAIGRQLGLITPGARAVTAAEIAAASDARLRELAGEAGVFARVAPEHKLRLVRALQAEGHVVAMTGDGVNDAPALKQANIGVAMGITGTAVSQEAADIVLADDNFASIAAAVEEGRRVYDNLVKSLAFVLPTNLGLALILLAAVTFFPIVDGTPLLPMSPTQILWINLVSTVALALPLAFEANEPDVMRRPPRAAAAPVLDRFVAMRTAGVATLMAAGAVSLFLWEYRTEVGRGVPAAVALAEAQTMAVTTVILFQIFYLLNCRSLRDSLLRIGVFSNPAVFAGIGALLLLQAAFVYLPFMNEVFGTAPLNGDALRKAVMVASIVLVGISAEKRWRRAHDTTARGSRGRSAPRAG